MTAPYKLPGNSIEEAAQQGVLQAPCIFCGKKIKHFNDGGVGWLLGAVVFGGVRTYLFCEQPACEAVERNYDQIWRCGCVSDYVENVGETCHACKRERLAARAWDYDFEYTGDSRLVVANLRAVVLEDVESRLPLNSAKIEVNTPFFHGIRQVLHDGELHCYDSLHHALCSSHITQAPLETLVALRDALDREGFKPCADSVAARKIKVARQKRPLPRRTRR